MPIKIYDMKAVLRGIEPPIWRRFAVSGNCGLAKLHKILQCLMRWKDYHLHVFHMKGKVYALDFVDPDIFPEGRENVFIENYFRIRSLLEEGDRFIYNYDFGDNWMLDLEVLKTGVPDKDVRYPICFDGERAGPPEDVGGIGGYQDFVEAIKNPLHEDHNESVEWAPANFNPDFFDLKAANKKLPKIR